MKKFAAVIFLLTTAALGQSLPKGFDHFYNFEFNEAIAEFRKATQEAPQEAQRYNQLARALLYREMLKSGMLESQLATGANPVRRSKLEMPAKVEEEFTAALAKAMELAQSRLNQSPQDAKALYALCSSYGLRGNWNFLVKKAYMDALSDLSTARKLEIGRASCRERV